ncbi:MAG TPA: hypothetical protein VIX63_12290 [Vicinamibacterales bacterium]
MASQLKWRMGFGWEPVLILACAAVAAVVWTGFGRWLAILAVVVVGGYLVYRYRKWNGRAWRQVHFRAMLAYSGIAGREDVMARQTGRPFDVRRACSSLGLLLCGEDRQAVVETMLAELDRYEGAFLAGLVERHAAEVLPGASLEVRSAVIARLRAVRFGPELVIASVIENIHGGAEAARYAIAVAAGDTR